jgi:hypothetical protein
MKRGSPLLWRLVLPFLLIGIIRSACAVWRDIQHTEVSKSWPMVEGRMIRHTDLNKVPWKGRHKSDEIVEYQFTVRGVAYLGRTVSFSRRSTWYHNEVKSFVMSLTTSPIVMVYFDPQSPQTSVLQPGGSNTANILFFTCQVLCVIAFATLIVMDVKNTRIMNKRRGKHQGSEL